MAWHQTGNEPVLQPGMIRCHDTGMRPGLGCVNLLRPSGAYMRQ